MMQDKSHSRSRKSFGFNISTGVPNAVCLKQNLIQQSHADDKAPADAPKKHPADVTISTRITSNLSSRKSSIDDAPVPRFRRPDAPKPQHERRLSMHNASVFHLNQGELPSPTVRLSRGQFSYGSVLGKGGFGKVWRVGLNKNQQQYALKEMSKAL